MAWALVAYAHKGKGGSRSMGIPNGGYSINAIGGDKLCLINDNQPKIKYRYN